MPHLSHHIFICTNERPPENPKGCCKTKGAEELVRLFKEAVIQNGLKATVRAQKAGCLDVCEHGPSVVIYPEGIWYGKVKPDDISEIIEKHLKQNQPVTRLLIRSKS